MRKFAFLTFLFVTIVLSGITFFSNSKISYADDIWKRFRFAKTLNFGQNTEFWVKGADKVELEYTAAKPVTLGVIQNGKFNSYSVVLPKASSPTRALIHWGFNREGTTYFKIQNNSFPSLKVKAFWLYGVEPRQVGANAAEKIPLVVTYGDSVIDGLGSGGPKNNSLGFVDLVAGKKGWKSLNFGVGGMSATCYGKAQYQKVISASPSAAVIIGFGTNDITGDYTGCRGTIDDFRNAMSLILSSIRSSYPSLPIYVEKIIPRKTISAETIAPWNQVIDEIAASSSAKTIDPSAVIDFNTDYFDNLHPNKQGHQKIADYWLLNM